LPNHSGNYVSLGLDSIAGRAVTPGVVPKHRAGGAGPVQRIDHVAQRVSGCNGVAVDEQAPIVVQRSDSRERSSSRPAAFLFYKNNLARRAKQHVPNRARL
jgi:hypothetical protein